MLNFSYPSGRCRFMCAILATISVFFILLVPGRSAAQEAKLIIPQGFAEDFKMSFDADESTLITYSNTEIKLWETSTNRLIATFRMPNIGLVKSVRYAPLLKRLYCLGYNGLAGWDVKTGALFLNLSIAHAENMALDEQNNMLIIADVTALSYYNATTGIQEGRFQHNFLASPYVYANSSVLSDGVSKFFFQDRGKYLLLDSRDRHLLSYAVNDAATGYFMMVDFDASQFVVKLNDKKLLNCYQLLTGKLVASTGFDKYVNTVEPAGKGKLLITGNETYTWNTATNEKSLSNLYDKYAKADGFYNEDIKGNNEILVVKSRVKVKEELNWKYRFLDPATMSVTDSLLLPLSQTGASYKKLLVGRKYLADVYSKQLRGTAAETSYPMIASIKEHTGAGINGIVNEYTLAAIKLRNEVGAVADKPSPIVANFFKSKEVFSSPQLTISKSKKYAVVSAGAEQGLVSYSFSDGKVEKVEKLFTVKPRKDSYNFITDELFSPAEKYVSFVFDSAQYVIDVEKKASILNRRISVSVPHSSLNDRWFVYQDDKDHVTILNLATNKSREIEIGDGLTSIALTPDDKIMLTFFSRIAVLHIDGTTLNMVELSPIRAAINADNLVYMVADNGNISVFNTQTRKLVYELKDAVDNIKYNNNGLNFNKMKCVVRDKWLAVVTNDQMLRVWDTQARTLRWKQKLGQSADRIVIDAANGKLALFSYGANGGIVIQPEVFSSAEIFNLESGASLFSSAAAEAQAKAAPAEEIKEVAAVPMSVMTEKGIVKMSIFDFSKKITYNAVTNTINASYGKVSLMIQVGDLKQKWQVFPGALESLLAKDAPYLAVNMFKYILLVNLQTGVQTKILDSTSNRILEITQKSNRLVAYGSKPASLGYVVMGYDLDDHKTTFSQSVDYMPSGFESSLSDDGRYLLLHDNKLNSHKASDTLRLLDTKNGNVLKKFVGQLDDNHFTPDGYLVSINYKQGDSAMIYDMKRGLTGYRRISSSNYAYVGGGWLFTNGLLVNLVTGKQFNCGYGTFYFQGANGRLMGFTETGFVEMDPVSGTISSTVATPSLGIRQMILTPDRRFYITLSAGNQLVKWDVEHLKPLGMGEVDATRLVSLSEHSDSTFIATDNEGFGSLISLNTLKPKANFTPSFDGNLNFYIPGKYYFVEKADIRKCYFNKDGELYSLDQFDIRYNRPDKVLQEIGYSDTALISAYRKAYEKRARKLGLDTAAFKTGYTAPDAIISNRDHIAFQQHDQELKLHISAKDAAFALNQLNVWINEVPVYGQKGIALKKGVRALDTVLSVLLSNGNNRIEVSVTNGNGTESYRAPLYVNYKPVNKEPVRTYFIGIGIDNFQQKEYNLQYSVKDIRDLTRKLKAKYGDGFVLVDTLFDERVTVGNIAKLKSRLAQTGVNDRVLIAYSGHGLLSKEYDYYLSTYQINFRNPKDKGLPYDVLEDLLDNIPARQKLMLIDACHSGEVDKEELLALTETDALRKSAGVKSGARGIEPEITIGLKDSFELMRELFVNVGKSTGATIISAAGGMQFALEKGDLQNGVFTYSILEALDENPKISVSELKAIVSNRVKELTAGAQQPTSRNENITTDWEVW